MTDQVLPEDRSPGRRLAARIGRHTRWARRDGLARLVEEDRLDPRERVPEAWARWRWRRAHGVAPGSAAAVFVLGVQRSGTNMVLRGLETRPEIEVRNENDRRVFHRYQLRPDDVLRKTVRASRHEIVLVKPLCDSHRALHLLDGLDLPVPPRVIWTYRGVDARARSAVAKFGDVNRTVLTSIAAGGDQDRWQAQGWSARTRALVEDLDPARLTPEAAAALFWLVRNRLFLDLGLQHRPDVLLVSYEQLVDAPVLTGQRLADFLDLPWSPAMHAHVDHRAGGTRPPLDLPAPLRAACDELDAELRTIERASLPPG